MEENVLLALLGLCVGLVTGIPDSKLREFDITKFSGFWYEIASASKIGAHGSPHKAEKMGAMDVKLEGNLLALTTTYYNEDRCVLEKVGAAQGDHPAKFKITRAAGSKEVVIVDTDYKTYAIMGIAFPVAETLHKALKLYSRNLNNNEDALSKYQKMALELGYSASDVHQEKHDLTCVNKLKSGLV